MILCKLHTIFQSTLPTRGETTLLRPAAPAAAISIHSPHTGRDDRTRHGYKPRAAISIHSPHTGRDRSTVCKSGRLRRFQSTLPTRGETVCPGALAGARCISIHSPHTGRDPAGVRRRADERAISIHSPHTGRDQVDVSGHTEKKGFQSTLPTRGETRNLITT